ncbi:hypothetical protein [Amycolatopsis nigrescens]|uniref:hypothetical protein n=1 Tax=Amycolatopsis nigrescens TaxID=381445 RepID=UPI000368D644|nr:hypothetical protein [Amycolatopsis nigrescens]
MKDETAKTALLDRAFLTAAAGRIAWGALALAAPRLNARLAGVGDRATPEVVYLTRIFGARAIALGLGYLGGDEPARRRWQRVCLFVDTADTAGGLGHLLRGDVRRGSALAMTLLTGSYAVLGGIGLLNRRRNIHNS